MSSADFKGVLLRLKTGDLTQESFMAIAPGQTLETEVDIAELYDVETDDSYTVQAMGAMRYAEAGDTKLAGALDFSSNALVMNINGTEAKEVPYALDAIVKRTRLNTGSCSTARLSAVRTALSNCARLASGAATAATSGSATTFNTFFKSTSSSVRSTVAARFRAIAADCGSTTSGGTTTYCNDPYGYCTSNVLAYAIPSQNIISYCPAFYSYLPALTSTCRAQDQAGTVLHEETHTPGVYSPGTQDYAYGYAASIRLSTSQALLNADSYALFANGKFLCRMALSAPQTNIFHSHLPQMLN